MGYKWKPSKEQKRAYAIKMKEAESFTFIGSMGAIREGCFISWVDKSTAIELSGTVINSSYGDKTGQHTFTVELVDGDKKTVKGRNLYDRLTSHKQGEKSKLESYGGKDYIAKQQINREYANQY